MGISEFEDSYEDEEAIRGAILVQPIRSLDPHEPVCVAPDTRLADALQIMATHRVGCVLVTEGERLVGIFTERDALKQAARSADQGVLIGDLMTRDPETVGMDFGIAYALNKMHVGGYRHIPVVDPAGRPVGVVSVRDFVRFIVGLFPRAALNIPPEPSLGVARTPDGA